MSFAFESRDELTKTECGRRATLKKEHDLDVNLVQLEVTELDSIKAAEKFIEEIEGRLDVLVNNGGQW